ncbi:MAG: hypothetical protein ABR961_09070 [Thermoanaerobaculaceae bacterium]|jgi:hypothetical protein
MIIHEPQVTRSAGEVRVEAAVNLNRPDASRPRTLWFAFPGTCERFVSDGADGFAAALIPLAMRLGETMRVRGSLSYRLAGGMRDYQRIQSAWKPDLFREVEILCEDLRSRDRADVSGGVGVAFSGGVDSFHAVWTHLAENEPYPPFRVSHCLMINGFDEDSDLGDTGSFRRIQEVYEPMMAAHGLELVVARTNLLQFLGPIVRAQSFASFLTAPALVLGRLFSRYYVSSGCKFTTLGMYPDGSSLMFDHLLATESMEVSHEDAHLTRFEKTVALSRWPATYDRLRVCFRATGVQEGRNAIANCCACEKCLRTMITLELAGALERYGSFPKRLERKIIRNADFPDAGRMLFADEIIEHAARAGRKDIVRDVRRAVFKSRWIHPKVREIVGASSRLEKHSGAYAGIVAAPKRFLKRLGWGRGWLY